jgi:hypothetical protein
VIGRITAGSITRAPANDPGLGQLPEAISEHVRSRAAKESLEIRITLRAIQQRINNVERPAIADILERHRKRTKPVIRAPRHRS